MQQGWKKDIPKNTHTPLHNVTPLILTYYSSIVEICNINYTKGEDYIVNNQLLENVILF